MGKFLAISAAMALFLPACAQNARYSRPYYGGKMPSCHGVWVTTDHRTWYCYSHEDFARWLKRHRVLTH